ncbi:MAG: hypothetical protein ABJZ80_12695, partial [Gilvibacter sp.]
PEGTCIFHLITFSCYFRDGTNSPYHASSLALSFSNYSLRNASADHPPALRRARQKRHEKHSL